MAIYERTHGFQVAVSDGNALKGYRRIRKQINGSIAQAQAIEAEITEALRVYRKWPVEPDDQPFINPEDAREPGTLRRATKLALQTHWAGTQWGKTVETCIPSIVRFFEEVLGVYNIDDVTSEHMDKFIEDCRFRGNKPETINKNLSMLSTINDVALKRKPPLCESRMPIQRVKTKALTKWWLRLEDLDRALVWLREEKGDPLFADFIEMMVKQGLRVEETLRLEPRNFSAMDTTKPWLQVPGTKTSEAGNSIPVFEWSVELVKRCIQRAKVLHQDTLFPYTRRQASDRWNEVRAYLGVSDIPTATLRALRRTFAHYATTLHGMPTNTLKNILRHRTIVTTEGYLNLVGNDDVQNARHYMEAPRREGKSPVFDISKAISAFMATGASPEDVARFTKEMMK